MLAWSGKRRMSCYRCPKNKIAISGSKRVLIDETRNQVFYYTKARNQPKVWTWSLEQEAEYAEELLREKRHEHGVRRELLLLEAMHSAPPPLLHRDEWGTYSAEEEELLKF